MTEIMRESDDMNDQGGESEGNQTTGEPYYEDPGCCALTYYRCCRKKQFSLPYRVIKPGNLLYPPIHNDNHIKNTNYNVITFFPVFFFNQFKYFFNFYYLCLCLSQFVDELKIGFLFTYIGPLAFVIVLSMINEIIDELIKYSRDLEVNNEVYICVVDGHRVAKKSGRLDVGDVLELREGQRAPADILILSTE